MSAPKRTIDDVNAELAGVAEEMADKWVEYMGVDASLEAHRRPGVSQMVSWLDEKVPEVSRLMKERAALVWESMADWTFDDIAQIFGWDEGVRAHALDSIGVEYGSECILRTPSGRELRCPAHPEPCHYVRVCEGGFEIAYWNMDELREDPEEVMAAIMGAAANGVFPKPMPDLRVMLLERRMRERQR